MRPAVLSLHRVLRQSLPPTCAALLFIAAGCASGSESAGRFTAVDSAGVHIATNAGVPDVGWGSIQVLPEPLLSLGTVAGDSVYQFSRIRGAVRLSDGRIAMVDGNARDVRVFDGDGVHLVSWGRRGGGPDEFERPRLAGLVGDTLVMFDADNRRLTWIDPDAGVVDQAPLGEGAGGYFQVQGVFDDGTIVSGGGFFFSSASGETLTTGLRRSPTGFVRIDREGEVATDFGQFPGLEMYFEVDGPRVSAGVIPFGRVTYSAVFGDRLYVGTADSPEVQIYNREGALTGVIRWETDDLTVSSDHLAAYVEDALADADDEDERRRVRLMARDHARSEFPAHGRIETDKSGNVWIQESRAPAEEPEWFRVFDPEGREIARVALPDRVQPLEIGDDYLLGLRRDDFDIEYIDLYRVERR